MNSTPRRIGLAALANLMVFALGAHDWPEFRGPTGQGHSPGKNVPIRWSVTENVAWKTAISGSGWSSPVLVDGRLYLTTAKPTEGAKELKLTAICLDSRDGKLLWSTNVFSPQDGRASIARTVMQVPLRWCAMAGSTSTSDTWARHV